MQILCCYDVHDKMNQIKKVCESFSRCQFLRRLNASVHPSAIRNGKTNSWYVLGLGQNSSVSVCHSWTKRLIPPNQAKNKTIFMIGWVVVIETRAYPIRERLTTIRNFCTVFVPFIMDVWAWPTPLRLHGKSMKRDWTIPEDPAEDQIVPCR